MMLAEVIDMQAILTAIGGAAVVVIGLIAKQRIQNGRSGTSPVVVSEDSQLNDRLTKYGERIASLEVMTRMTREEVQAMGKSVGRSIDQLRDELRVSNGRRCDPLIMSGSTFSISDNRCAAAAAF